MNDASPPADRPAGPCLSQPLARSTVAAVCAAGAAGLLRVLAGAPWVPELAAQALFARIPMAWFRVVVGLLGSWAKWVALAGTTTGYVAFGIAFGVLVLRLADPLGRQGTWPAWQVIAGGMLVGGAHWLALRLFLAPAALVPQLSGPLSGPGGHLAADLVAGMLFVAILTSRRLRGDRGRICGS